MSNPHLPAELLDHIVDFLHDTEDTLKNCCLVSKSWIPQTRKHLFAYVWFEVEEDLESWRKMFPDPSASPGRHAKTLIIDCPQALMVTDAEAGGWIRGFSHVVHLGVTGRGVYDDKLEIFLEPLQGFSPFVKALNIDCISTLPSSCMFDLILSFPLLEDLAVTNYNYVTIDEGGGSNRLLTLIQPSSPPMFTGSLKLVMIGLVPIIRRLLSLPRGIHFREFALSWDPGEDISLITALVESCSHTLESLDITCSPLERPATIDLSKTTKLRDIVFRPTSLSVEWITTALQTTMPKHRELWKISIGFPLYLASLDTIKRSPAYGQWLDLDRLLVQFWESRSTGPKVICTIWKWRKQDARCYMECLLPKLTKRGVVDLVE